jgi:GxxExxY protein
MDINAVSGQIVDAAMRVHTVLGPGLLEHAYQVCLAHELRKRGRRVDSEVLMPVVYDGLELGLAYRIDLLVEECVVVEIKAVASIPSRPQGPTPVAAQAERPARRFAHQLQRRPPQGWNRSVGELAFSAVLCASPAVLRVSVFRSSAR